MTKKIILGIKCFAMMLLLMILTNLPNIAASTELKIGDYVTFGTYNNEPILWRIIYLDSDGDPLLFSEKILSFKAFDAGGSLHLGERRYWGSNEWESSNIRQWLNSVDNQIKWFNNTPNKENVMNGVYAYDSEPGFLASYNFSQSDINAIKPVTHEVTLSESDKFKRTGGTEPHKYSMGNFYQDVLINYDQAYTKNVKDYVFLLSIKEVINYVHDRGWSYNAFPTQEAINKSIYSTYYDFDVEPMSYWLRTPNASIPSEVRRVSKSDGILTETANSGLEGIRPALFVDHSKLKLSSGSGTNKTPFVLESTDSSKIDENKFKFESSAREKLVRDPSKKYPVYIFVDGMPLVSLDAAPFVDSNGRTMIPLKAVGDSLGVSVSWNSQSKMAIVQAEDKKIELHIGENYGLVNNERIEFDTTTIVKNGRTYVPLRFISEQLGYEINYRFDLNPIAENQAGHMIEVGKPAFLVSPMINKGWKNAYFNREKTDAYYSMFKKIPASLNGISQVTVMAGTFYMSHNPSDGTSFNWVYVISYEAPGSIDLSYSMLPTGWDEFTINSLTALIGSDGTYIGSQIVKDVMSTYVASDNTYYALRLSDKVITSGKYTFKYSNGKITWVE